MSTITALAPPQAVDELSDAAGLIPSFGPVALDAQGRIVMSEKEQRARAEAAVRTLAALRELSDEDPANIEAEMMRGIDEGRPHRKLFEGWAERCSESSCSTPALSA